MTARNTSNTNNKKLNEKKELEKHHLARFISNEKLKLLVHSIKESETPDFILNINKRLVSIEHTRLINPNLKKIEKHKEKIIKNAQERFEEKYSDKLYVLITFNNIHLKSGKIAEQEYSDIVFKLIEEIYLCNQKYEFKIDCKEPQQRTSELINDFSVDNTRGFSHWQHFGAYLVESINIEWFQNIITRKEKNIKNYPENLDENWLLLVSNFGTKASTHNYDRIDFSQIKTTFDKVYLYSFMSDKIEIVK